MPTILTTWRKFEHAPNFFYIHFKTNAAFLFSLTLEGYWRHPIKQENQLPRQKRHLTSFDVMCVLALWIVTTSGSRDWSRDVTSLSEPIQWCSHSYWLPRAQNLVFKADENCRFEARFPAQITLP